MGFTTFLQYMIFIFLWVIPLVKIIRLVLSFRSSYYTSTGRLIDISQEREKTLEEKLKKQQIFLDKNRKIDDVKVIEIPNLNIASVIGFHHFIKPAIIVISPGLDILSLPLLHWFYRRLGYFLLTQAQLVIEIIKILAIVISIIVFGKLCIYSIVLPYFLVFFTSKIVELICLYIIEIRADDYVLTEASLEELQEGLFFLKAQLREFEKKDKFQNFCQFFSKKTLIFRTKKLELAIGKENLKEDEQKIVAIQNFLQQNLLAEQQFLEAKKMRVLRWIDADED